MHGDPNEKVYLNIPLGFVAKWDKRIRRNTKSLYELRQALHQRFSKLPFTLIEYGFVKSIFNNSLFLKNNASSFIALFYVNGIILASNDIISITALKIFLDDRFKIKDLGALKYFLGFEVASSKKGITLCQKKYELDILQDSRLLTAKPVQFRMEQNIKISSSEGDLIANASSYQRLIGRLIYLIISGLDLIYAIQVFSQYMNKPR